MSQQFASDNNAGLCPPALEALLAANAAGHAPGYGDDRWTAEAKDKIATLFGKTAGKDVEVFFVFNGTAANALAIAHVCPSYTSYLAHESSHAAEDECGAPEFHSGGAKLVACPGENGKITPATVADLGRDPGRVHGNRPALLSLTQSTEMGTVYRFEELRDLTAVARRHGLRVHMDGARFANAVATLGCAPADITWRAGIDILSFGATKNGLAVGEAVVFFDTDLARDFDRRIKQAGQLNSKMRLVAAPWIGLIEGGHWLANARHANAMAQRLESKLAGTPGLRVLFPVEANVVFAEIKPAVQAAARAKGWRFYTFLGETGCRLMCAWDTTPDTVDRFAADLADAARGAA